MCKKIILFCFLLLFVTGCTNLDPFGTNGSLLVGWMTIISFGIAVIGGLTAMFGENELAASVGFIALIASLILIA